MLRSGEDPGRRAGVSNPPGRAPNIFTGRVRGDLVSSQRAIPKVAGGSASALHSPFRHGITAVRHRMRPVYWTYWLQVGQWLATLSGPRGSQEGGAGLRR